MNPTSFAARIFDKPRYGNRYTVVFYGVESGPAKPALRINESARHIYWFAADLSRNGYGKEIPFRLLPKAVKHLLCELKPELFDY